MNVRFLVLWSCKWSWSYLLLSSFDKVSIRRLFHSTFRSTHILFRRDWRLIPRHFLFLLISNQIYSRHILHQSSNLLLLHFQSFSHSLILLLHSPLLRLTIVIRSISQRIDKLDRIHILCGLLTKIKIRRTYIRALSLLHSQPLPKTHFILNLQPHLLRINRSILFLRLIRIQPFHHIG